MSNLVSNLVNNLPNCILIALNQQIGKIVNDFLCYRLALTKALSLVKQACHAVRVARRHM